MQKQSIAMLKVKNLMMISGVEFACGQINQIVGRNDNGKTAMLKAIEFGAKGSKDTSLIKIGETEMEVMFEMADKGTVRRKLTSDGKSTVQVENGDGVRQGSPQTVLDMLFDASSFNPLDLLQKENWNDAIMKAIPLSFTKEELAKAIGLEEKKLPELDYTQHGIKVLEEAYKYFYSRRAEANKDAKEKENRYRVQKEALPPQPEPAKLSVEQLTAERAKITEEMKPTQAALFNLNSDTERVTELASKSNRATADVEKVNADIDELQAKISTLRASLAPKEEHAAIALAEYNKAKAELPDAKDLHLKMAGFDKRLGEVTAQEEAHKRTDATLKQYNIVDGLLNEHSIACAAAEKLDALVKNIAGPVKAAALDSVEMPVPGLTYQAGEFLVDGINRNNLSMSKKIKLAVAVARKRSGRMKVICIDGAEQLDAETFQAFHDEIKDDGFTYFVSKVGEPFDTGDTVIRMDQGKATIN